MYRFDVYKLLKEDWFDWLNNPTQDMQGSSFIINPQKLYLSRHNLEHKYNYLVIASIRNILDYYYYKDTCLNANVLTLKELEQVDKNPLLSMNDNKIYFEYENE